LQALYFAGAMNIAFELSINIGTETIADRKGTCFTLIINVNLQLTGLKS
jgi:hypothetical protein